MNSDFSDLLRCLNRSKAEYLVVGGYAVMYHGEPRYTKDLDVWVRPEPANALLVYRALADFGAPLQGTAVEDFARPGMVYQIGIPPVRIDVLMSIDGVEFEQAWPQRVRVDFGSVEGWVISKQDLIRNKRASARPQDLLDVALLEAAE